ncbi:unnamed protein product [Staurois parvus]|uniref:Uncharacterized protein n=1 Tax=Staurois parvus TaxID=386267 RepID=A0ABN9BSK3_9NEOB|nr:unnamed protein product [Staurois parvus]
MALHSRAIQSSVLTVKHTHTQHTVKQHTVNLWSPQMLTPSCPVSLVQSRGGLTTHGATGQ